MTNSKFVPPNEQIVPFHDRYAAPNDGDLVIVSMHENGFPTADLYIGANWDDDLEGVPADSFFTMKRGDTVEAACAKAREKWPNARVMVAEDEEPEDDE